MNPNQLTARGFGVVFLLVGVPRSRHDAALAAPRTFPSTSLHKLVHLVFGVWGLVASGAMARASAYCRLGGIAYVALAVVGDLDPNRIRPRADRRSRRLGHMRSSSEF